MTKRTSKTKKRTKIKKKNILLCGSFHGNNLGDVAILDSVLRQYNDRYDVTVTTKNPKKLREVLDINSNVKLIKAINPFALFFSILKADIVQIGGGGLFFDYSGIDTLSVIGKSQLLVWISITVLSGLLRKKVCWLGIGIGEFSRMGKFLMKIGLLFVNHVEVRDKNSLDRLINNFKYLKAQKSGDWVYLAEEYGEVVRKHTNNKRRKGKIKVGIVLKERKGIREEAGELLKKISELYTDFELVLLTTNPDKDNALHKELADKFDLKFVDTSSLTLGEFSKEINKLKYIISMRMHALLLGFQQGVLGIGISSEPLNDSWKYLNKVEQIQEELYEEVLASRTLSFDTVKEKIDTIVFKDEYLRTEGLKNYTDLQRLSQHNLKVIENY